MDSLQSDVPPSRPVSTKVRQVSHFENEINLADYFKVLWKRKYLIVLGSVLPALVVGLVIFFAVLLMITTFVAFLLEGVQKGENQVS